MRSATESEIDEVIRNPRGFVSDPDMLFVGYVLDTLKGMLIDYDDFYDEGEEEPELWGLKIEAKTFDRLLDEMADEFCECAKERKQIRIGGSGYTMRNAEGVSAKKLKALFQFQNDGKEYVIETDGILVDDGIEEFSKRKSELGDDKRLLRRIVYYVEVMGGWETLTDIEAAAYCWYVNQSKEKPLDVDDWAERYKPSHGLDLCDVMKAWANGKPKGMFTFSQRLVDDFNRKWEQESYLDEVPDEKADDYKKKK